MSVIDIKTVISADPEKSFVILHDTNDGTVGKSVDLLICLKLYAWADKLERQVKITMI